MDTVALLLILVAVLAIIFFVILLYGTSETSYEQALEEQQRNKTGIDLLEPVKHADDHASKSSSSKHSLTKRDVKKDKIKKSLAQASKVAKKHQQQQQDVPAPPKPQPLEAPAQVQENVKVDQEAVKNVVPDQVDSTVQQKKKVEQPAPVAVSATKKQPDVVKPQATNHPSAPVPKVVEEKPLKSAVVKQTQTAPSHIPVAKLDVKPHHAHKRSKKNSQSEPTKQGKTCKHC